LARELELSSLETIYLLLVAPDGTILWQGEGTADEKQISAPQLSECRNDERPGERKGGLP